MLKKLKKNYLLIIFIILQIIFYIIAGNYKQYLHMDEAYSFGLASYDKTDIQDNSDFFWKWHTKDYYSDYLEVNDDEVGAFSQVYENQKNDVHPPFYYLLLRSTMGLFRGFDSKWIGIGLNIIIYIFITIMMYLICKKILSNVDDKTKKSNQANFEDKVRIKSSILAFMSSVILASISNVIYIRMYALLTLIVLITTYLHMKLLENVREASNTKNEKKANENKGSIKNTEEKSNGRKLSLKLLIGIGITALAGILTHYYYIVFLGFMYLFFLVKYIKQKNIKHLACYTLTILIAVVTSLIIFPYSINHIFFGYRGQSVISKIENISELIPSIAQQIHNLNYYVFNGLLYFIVIAIIGILIYCSNKKRKSNINKETNESAKKNKVSGISQKEMLKLIAIPSILFFIVTTIASPWNVLRYIVPVCGLIFVLVMLWFHKILNKVSSEKIANIIICTVFCLMLVLPPILKLQPELLYLDRRKIVEELSNEYNLPALYLYNEQNGRFLDDILLFTKLDESYITKNIECTRELIEEIFKEKNISNGIILFVNERDKNDSIANEVGEYLHFRNCTLLKGLTSCDVYYLN